MAKKTPMTDDQWRKVGDDLKWIHRELQVLYVKLGPHVTKKSTEGLNRALGGISQARSDLEDEMFRRGGPQDIGVFYCNRRNA